MQLVGSLGLPDNIREILTQLDENDILVFFDAFKLPVPSTFTNNEMFSHKSLLIEILIKECTPAAQATSKISELTLFPTERDLWAWSPFGDSDDNERLQTSYTSLQEMLLFQIDTLLKREARQAEKFIGAEINNIEPQFDSESNG